MGVFEKNQNFIYFKKHPNCFAHNSATKYRSEAVLYSKRTAGYPLSPHIKTIATAFFTSWVIKQQKCSIFKVLKKHPTSGVRCAPKMSPKNGNYIFSEACTSWLIGICKKNYKKGIFVRFWGGVSKKNFSIFQVFWTVYFAVCHIYIY